jgi:hypothetical protein
VLTDIWSSLGFDPNRPRKLRVGVVGSSTGGLSFDLELLVELVLAVSR